MRTFIHFMQLRIEPRLRWPLFLLGLWFLRRDVQVERTSYVTMRLLSWGWGNARWRGSCEFLRAVALVTLKSDGMIVEAGSGLTTIVIAAYAGPQRRVVALEHDSQWRRRVLHVANRFHNCDVRLAPLVNYGDYDWYSTDALSGIGRVGMLVVDGPPGETRGGRYGALPQLVTKSSSPAIVLLDDVDRPVEARILIRWQKEFGLKLESPGIGDSRTFAIGSIN